MSKSSSSKDRTATQHNNVISLDQLIGVHKQCLRDHEADRSGGL
jgi:hypothetical protein